MLFASTGALVCAGSSAIAGDSDKNVERTQVYQSEEKVEVRSDTQLNQPDAEFDAQIINEPSGAERRSYSSQRSTTMHAPAFGAVHKASDIIGMEVRNHQGEKLGDVKDVMVDMRTGRIPFAVLSTEGMGNRLVAVPPSALNAKAGQNELVLNMDRERLRSAPSFERNRWPDMANQQWSSDVYRFYGTQPYWQSSSYQSSQPYQRRSEFHQEQWVSEPAGAPTYHGNPYAEDADFEDSNTLDDINKGSNTRGGAEDLQRFDEKANARRGVTTPKHWGADSSVRSTHWEQTTHHGATTVGSMGRLHRATDLIGMNIKNAQNETVGEIEDVVLDLHSGHVAYTVVDAGRFIDSRDEFVAIPPSLFTYGGEGRTVTLNANRDVLMNAPRFESENWSQVSNERYVSRVYSHYGQQPYWQAQSYRQGTQFREPSGAEFEQRNEQNYQRHEFQQEHRSQDQFQQNDSSFQEQQDISEPSGAESGNLELQRQESAPAISEPSGAEVQSELAPDVSGQDSLQQDQSLQRETQEPALEQQEPERAISEPSGAQPDSQAPESETSIESEATGSQTESSSTEVESSESQPAAPSAGFETESSSQVQDPSGAESQSETSVEAETPEAAQHDAAIETEQQSSVTSEPSGAAVQSESATQGVDEAAGAAVGAGAAAQPEQSVEHVRSTLKTLSGVDTANVQVSSEGGKIILRGTVKSETEKQQIEEKVQGAVIDNQIQVEGQSQTETPSQP